MISLSCQTLVKQRLLWAYIALCTNGGYKGSPSKRTKGWDTKKTGQNKGFYTCYWKCPKLVSVSSST
jgi:hypothetical protein